MPTIPLYSELLTRTDAPAGSSWGIFGAEDQVGTLNFIDSSKVQKALGTPRRGMIFNLDHHLMAFDPPPAPHRENPKHTIFNKSPHHRDDRLDGLFLQASSQIDGLRHWRHPTFGFYNNTLDSDVRPGSPHLGINRYAERGIVGRGVLLDLQTHLASRDRRLDHKAGEAFPVALLDEVLESQGSKIEPGDILMLRTGFLDWYFNSASDADRKQLPKDLRSPGLVQSHETLAWLWDHRISVCASDNVAVEAIPSVPDSPFKMGLGDGAHAGLIAGMMHPTMIAMLGMCLGELWDLEALAKDCAADGIYESMVVIKPLNLIGGVGSPANALAVK